jgi:hypothetical protein
MWKGLNRLRNFISSRSVFFDEDHHLVPILEVGPADGGRVRGRTGCASSCGALNPVRPRSEEFTGEAVHTWLLQPGGGGPWRVAAQLIGGFAALNEPARRLFSMPDKGLNT